MKKLRLTFHGGAQAVTGANFLLEGPGKEGETFRLLVDCGLQQSGEFCPECNYKDFIYDPKSIDVLLVTHAHLDHVGRIPKLVRDGFRGVIYSTPSTLELAQAMLGDSIDILRREAERLKKDEPLYSEDDLHHAFSLWKTVLYYEKTELSFGVTFTFKDAGHILGSAMIDVVIDGKKIVFTGDVGNSPTPLLRDTDPIDKADYLVMESVYGDREHEGVEERTLKLREIIKEAVARGGALLIPAFSIERTQILLYELNNLIEEKEIPHVPVFLDSPLAIAVTGIYKKRKQNFNEAVQKEIQDGDDIFNFPNLIFTEAREESQAIIKAGNPKIIIAGSGMSHGGRIIFHEKLYLGDPSTTILFVGYQAAGSLGRQIQEGIKKVTILGKPINVKAQVRTISGYSAHKDMNGLVELVARTAPTLKRVFVAMGEAKSSFFLAQRLRDYEGVDAVVPEEDESFEIEI